MGVPEVPCPIEMIILMNSAACVKEYWRGMRGSAAGMIKELFVQHENIRIGVVKYSTNAEVVSTFKTKAEYKALTRLVKNAKYMGHGDFINKGLNQALDMFTNNDQRLPNTRKVLMVITNSGVVEKHSLAKVKAATLKLRQASIDMMVTTITGECKEQKACLSCCPDFNFLQKYITTRDRICAGQPSNKDPRYRECINKMNYMCPGSGPQPGKCRKRGCDCECQQKKGPMGLMGPPGYQGQPGQPGRSGMDGKPGSPGKAGINGEDGLSSRDVAPNGRQGKTGATGSQGPRGPPGPPGPDGAECGPMGPSGSRGVPGPDGAHGNPGQNGAPGKCGEVGRPGQPGSRGKPGLPGDAGNKGTPGTPGSKGQDGPPGVNGVPGRQGPPGPDGEQGPRGRPGPPACAISLNSYQYIIKEEIQRKLASYPHTFRC